MNFSIIPFVEEKYKKALLTLWKENLSLSNHAFSLEDRYDWLYHKNPLGPPSTFIAINTESDQAIGTASAFPREISFLGTHKKILILCDFAVSKKYRVFGPAVPLQKEIKKLISNENVFFLFAYPNAQGSGIFNRLGYTYVGDVENWTKVLYPKAILRSHIKNELLNSIISFVLSLFFNLIDQIFLSIYRIFYYAEPMGEIDDCFDHVWKNNRYKSRYIIGLKDSEYLRWRYKRSGDDIEIMGLFRKRDKRLVGYVIYKLRDDVVLVQDIFTVRIKGQIKAILLFLATAMRGLKKKSIFISFYGSNEITDTFKKIFFVKRPGDRKCFLLTDETIQYEIKSKNNWSFFDGDLDI